MSFIEVQKEGRGPGARELPFSPRGFYQILVDVQQERLQVYGSQASCPITLSPLKVILDKL